MARLYRPHIPLEVRCKVLARQTGFDPASVEKNKGRYKGLYDTLLVTLALFFGCQTNELRLDHDPALALRLRRGLGRKVYYTPDANDPEFLLYRPHGTQFDGSHDVKTRIRGEHGQFSDVALIKRQRRREKPPTKRQAKLAEIRERQKKLRREIAEKRKAGKKVAHGWATRPFRSKKSPNRFGAT